MKASLTPTAQRALDAYGGADLWLSSKSGHARVSAKGWAFVLKRRPAFENAEMSFATDRPYCRLTPIGERPGITGVLDGLNVRLEDPQGRVIATRENARAAFPFGRRTFWWDDMDMAWFACYAFWNYFTLPRLLLNSDIQWTERVPGHLSAVFPDRIPTHSPRQDFYFDLESGRLLRHDYIAAVVAPVAHAANRVLDHATQDGLVFPCARQVTPIGLGNRPLRGPVLIDLLVHAFSITR